MQEKCGHSRRKPVGSSSFHHASGCRTRERMDAAGDGPKRGNRARSPRPLSAAQDDERMVEVLCRRGERRQKRWKPPGRYGAPAAPYYPGPAWVGIGARRHGAGAGRYGANPATFAPTAEVSIAGLRPLSITAWRDSGSRDPGVIWRESRDLCPRRSCLRGGADDMARAPRPLARDREQAGRRNSLIKKGLWLDTGIVAGVIWREARDVSGSFASRLPCWAAFHFDRESLSR